MGKVKSSKSIVKNPGQCLFCMKNEDNEEKLGILHNKCGIIAHYYCLLFASALCQKGKTKQGIQGFLPEDVTKEIKRARSLRCCYCKTKGATIGCCIGKCKRSFHFSCGRDNNTFHQFYGNFQSYCKEHWPVTDQPPADRSPVMDCSICLSELDTRMTTTAVWSTCCSNGWFHRDCVQRYALSSGKHYLKCPLCNNKDAFQSAMLERGLYIPEQDAAWEREPGAFADLYRRHDSCDVRPKCQCPQGRKSNQENTQFELVLCEWCGAAGTHLLCSSLTPGKSWLCSECSEMRKRTQEIIKLNRKTENSAVNVNQNRRQVSSRSRTRRTCSFEGPSSNERFVKKKRESTPSGSCVKKDIASSEISAFKQCADAKTEFSKQNHIENSDVGEVFISTGKKGKKRSFNSVISSKVASPERGDEEPDVKVEKESKKNEQHFVLESSVNSVENSEDHDVMMKNGSKRQQLQSVKIEPGTSCPQSSSRDLKHPDASFTQLESSRNEIHQDKVVSKRELPSKRARLSDDDAMITVDENSNKLHNKYNTSPEKKNKFTVDENSNKLHLNFTVHFSVRNANKSDGNTEQPCDINRDALDSCLEAVKLEPMQTNSSGQMVTLENGHISNFDSQQSNLCLGKFEETAVVPPKDRLDVALPKMSSDTIGGCLLPDCNKQPMSDNFAVKTDGHLSSNVKEEQSDVPIESSDSSITKPLENDREWFQRNKEKMKEEWRSAISNRKKCAFRNVSVKKKNEAKRTHSIQPVRRPKCPLPSQMLNVSNNQLHQHFDHQMQSSYDNYGYQSQVFHQNDRQQRRRPPLLPTPRIPPMLPLPQQFQPNTVYGNSDIDTPDNPPFMNLPPPQQFQPSRYYGKKDIQTSKMSPPLNLPLHQQFQPNRFYGRRVMCHPNSQSNVDTLAKREAPRNYAEQPENIYISFNNVPDRCGLEDPIQYNVETRQSNSRLSHNSIEEQYSWQSQFDEPVAHIEYSREPLLETPPSSSNVDTLAKRKAPRNYAEQPGNISSNNVPDRYGLEDPIQYNVEARQSNSRLSHNSIEEQYSWQSQFDEPVAHIEYCREPLLETPPSSSNVDTLAKREAPRNYAEQPGNISSNNVPDRYGLEDPIQYNVEIRQSNSLLSHDSIEEQYSWQSQFDEPVAHIEYSREPLLETPPSWQRKGLLGSPPRSIRNIRFNSPLSYGQPLLENSPFVPRSLLGSPARSKPNTRFNCPPSFHDGTPATNSHSADLNNEMIDFNIQGNYEKRSINKFR